MNANLALKQAFSIGDEVIVTSDRHPGFRGAWGIVRRGDDAMGYEVHFSDILAADDPSAHVLGFPADELVPAAGEDESPVYVPAETSWDAAPAPAVEAARFAVGDRVMTNNEWHSSTMQGMYPKWWGGGFEGVIIELVGYDMARVDFGGEIGIQLVFLTEIEPDDGEEEVAVNEFSQQEYEDYSKAVSVLEAECRRLQEERDAALAAAAAERQTSDKVRAELETYLQAASEERRAEIRREVSRLMASKQLIEAIKLYRRHHDVSIAEAREAVRAIAAEMPTYAELQSRVEVANQHLVIAREQVEQAEQLRHEAQVEAAALRAALHPFMLAYQVSRGDFKEFSKLDIFAGISRSSVYDLPVDTEGKAFLKGDHFRLAAEALSSKTPAADLLKRWMADSQQRESALRDIQKQLDEARAKLEVERLAWIEVQRRVQDARDEASARQWERDVARAAAKTWKRAAKLYWFEANIWRANQTILVAESK